MFRRPLTFVAIVFVMFGLGGMVRLATRGAAPLPNTPEPEEYRAAPADQAPPAGEKPGYCVQCARSQSDNGGR